MRIHNDSLIRVVLLARAAGALLIANGMFRASMAIISAIRHSSDIPWTKLATASLDIVPGIALLMLAPVLDRGRILAFYAITAMAVAEVMLTGTNVLVSMSFRPLVLLLPMLGLAAACSIAWHPARGLRRPKSYGPQTPRPSTTVVVPPPPVRKKHSPPSPTADSSDAMVIEIRQP